MKHCRLIFLIGFVLLMFSFSVSTSGAQDIISSDDYVGYHEDDQDFDIEETPDINDPYESYNRVIFKFNNTVYHYILNPVSQGYDFLLPKKVQSSIDKLFSNAKMPIRFFNNLFQGKFETASTEMGRFLINSTIGLGGLFDPARSVFNLEIHTEDFGQTLGYHGMGSGNYIVWPILGPSNGRDSIGFIVDIAFDPLTWLSILPVEPDEVFSGINGVRYVNGYSYNVRDNYEDIIKLAIDPYISMRHAYTWSRRKKVEE
ncbi:VacJ family lipoprotein [bacterium]|nr:VacJ family lipoprotein [bacterium]